MTHPHSGIDGEMCSDIGGWQTRAATSEEGEATGVKKIAGAISTAAVTAAREDGGASSGLGLGLGSDLYSCSLVSVLQKT